AAGFFYRGFRQARCPRDLQSEGAAGSADVQDVQRRHALLIEAHCCVAYSRPLSGKYFQIVVVRCDDTPHPLLQQFFQDCLCYGPAKIRVGAGAHFVNEYERSFIGMAHEQVHVVQVAAVGTQVILYRLLVADVKKHAPEYTHEGVGMSRHQHTALQHILQQTHRFKTHGFTAGVRTAHQEHAIVLVKIDRQGHHWSLTFECQTEQRDARVAELQYRLRVYFGKVRFYGACILCPCPDEIDLREEVEGYLEVVVSATYVIR